jgi:DNA-binding HxlR family transcriptional regulator
VSVCAACKVQEGVCPDCGTRWFRNAEGKLLGAQDAPNNFWRNSGTLRDAIPQAATMDDHFAEAVDALSRLWNVVVFRLLSDQQSAALVLTHTRGTISSGEVATALSISQQAASNVLQTLVQKDLLERATAGRYVRYSVRLLWPIGAAPKAAHVVLQRRTADLPVVGSDKT